MHYFSLNFEDVGLAHISRFGSQRQISTEEVAKLFKKGVIRSCCRPEYLPTLRRVVEHVLGTQIPISQMIVQAGPYWRKGDIIIMPVIAGISFRDGREIEDLVNDQVRRGRVVGFVFREVVRDAPKKKLA